MFLQSVSTAALEKALSATWQRMELITHNISNEDTPGYKAKRLDFESMLAGELSKIDRSDRPTAIQRLDSIQPNVYEITSTLGRADENNVDILAEQAELARTILQHQALSQRVSGYYSTLKYAISGGR